VWRGILGVDESCLKKLKVSTEKKLHIKQVPHRKGPIVLVVAVINREVTARDAIS
jgi:hypothetical protein